MAFDRAIRASHLQPSGTMQLRGQAQAYLHPTLVPLDQADLSASPPKDHRQRCLLDAFRAEDQGVGDG